MTARMGRVYVIGILALVAGFLVGPVRAQEQAPEEVVDRIVATVNNDIILQSDVEKALTPYIKNIKERGLPEKTEEMMLAKAHADILNNLINEKLTIQKAAELGITADDHEVDAALEQMKTSMLYSDEAFRFYLNETGYTMAEYRGQVKNQILKSKLLRQEIKAKTVVTPDEIKEYYEKSRNEFPAGTQYHLKHIIMQVPKGADAEAKKAIREKMEGIRQQIIDGAPFEAMAEKYSQSSFAKNGGDIGRFAENDLSEELKDAITHTQAGGITPVIETDMGYQLFYVQSVSKNDGSLNDDVADKIREKLYNKKLDEKFDAWIKQLRDSASVNTME